jgi:hypothetical protein
MSNRLSAIKEEIKRELMKVKDLHSLKQEITKIAGEVNLHKLDGYVKINPQHKKKLRDLEQKYHVMMRQFSQAQKQFDRDLTDFMKVLKKARTDAEKRFTEIKKITMNSKTKSAFTSKKGKKRTTRKSAATN